MTKIINLYGGPGSGKSTTAADLFQIMKKRNHKVELVTEYAKDMVYEDRHNILEDQVYVFAKQHRRISRLIDKVDWIITDSPILLSLIYANKDCSLFPIFKNLVLGFYNRYENYDCFIVRGKDYQEYGRNHTQEEAKKIDQNILDFFFEIENDFTLFSRDNNAGLNIYLTLVYKD